MSQSSSESLPESPTVQPSTQGELAKKPAPGLSKVLKWWWIPTSYFIPYLTTISVVPVVSLKEGMERGGRIGTIGLIAAFLVYLVWLIDLKFGAKQYLGQSRDKVAKSLVYLLALALWVSWLAAGIVMTMTYDQVNTGYILPSMRVQ